MPSYEVRETSSGTLILVPIPAGENATPFKNVFKQAVSDPMVSCLLFVQRFFPLKRVREIK